MSKLTPESYFSVSADNSPGAHGTSVMELSMQTCVNYELSELHALFESADRTGWRWTSCQKPPGIWCSLCAADLPAWGLVLFRNECKGREHVRACPHWRSHGCSGSKRTSSRTRCPTPKASGTFLLLESYDTYLQASTGSFLHLLCGTKTPIVLILAFLSHAFGKHKPDN